jgi:tetratricopeptide (TPR) repeat protein
MVLAADAGFRALVGRCYEQHVAQPFLPFREMLSSATRQTRAMRASSPFRSWPEFARLNEGGQPGLSAPVSGAEAKLEVLHAFMDLLRTWSTEQPLAILLDDLHNADSGSLELLNYLARELRDQRVLLLGTYRASSDRTTPFVRARAEAMREQLAVNVSLRRLPAQGTAALARALLESSTVPEALVDFVHSRSDGNPLLARAILNALVERGLISIGSADWLHVDTAAMRVPDSVQALVTQRVAHLPSAVRQLLSLACVLGLEFDLDVLLAASDEPEGEVFDCLDRTLDIGLIEERRGAALGRFGFTHALVQQALYEGVSAHRLQRLHRQAGEALERLRGERAQAAPELARHFFAAGDAERALRYCISAGDFAASLYGHHEAIRQYITALELLGEGGQELSTTAAEVRRKLGGQFNDLNQVPQALEAYERALVVFEHNRDLPGQARVHREIAWVHQVRFDMAAAAPHLDAALSLWPADEQSADLAHLHLDAARAHCFAGEYSAAEPHVKSGLALAEQSGEPLLLARALIDMGVFNGQSLGVSDLVLPLYARAESIARRERDWYLLTRIYMNQASETAQAGDQTGCREKRRQALEAARRSGRRRDIAYATYCVALASWELGDWAAARDIALEAYDLDPEQSYRYLVPWLDGDTERALDMLREDAGRARTTRFIQDLALVPARLADCLLQLERFSEAEKSAREAADILCSHDCWHWTVEVFGTVAEAVVCSGSADAEAVLSKASARANSPERAGAEPQISRARGLFLASRGDLGRAVAALNESVNLARVQRHTVQLGRSLSALENVATQAGESEMAVRANRERRELLSCAQPIKLSLTWVD